MEMDMRQYDPALARWTGIDPVTHHTMSTYAAFDNDPVFWVDPSGADSGTMKIQDLNGNWHTLTEDDYTTLYSSNTNDSDYDKGIENPDPIVDRIYGEIAAFGDKVDYTYKLLDDEKGIHRITITGVTYFTDKGKRKKRYEELEVIIIANEGKPKIMSTKLITGIYKKSSRCMICGDGGHFSLEKKHETDAGFSSHLVDYLANPVKEMLIRDSEWNLFNKPAKYVDRMADILVYQGFAASAYYGARQRNIYADVFGKKTGRKAVILNLAFGALYKSRKMQDYTGKSYTFTLYERK
ncbi:protein of unknown function [Tenacibaculum sp. 190524A02b]